MTIEQTERYFRNANLRIEKTFNAESVKDVAQKVVQRTFLTQKADEFVKSGVPNVNKKGMAALAAAVSAGAAALLAQNSAPNNDIDSKIAEFCDTKMCNDKERFTKILHLIKEENQEFLNKIIDDSSQNMINVKKGTTFSPNEITIRHINESMVVSMNDQNKVIASVYKNILDDGTVIQNRKDYIQDADGYIETKSTYVKDGNTTYEIKTPIIKDVLGGMHQYTINRVVDDKERILSEVQTNLNGETAYYHYKYNEKNRESEVIKDLYSSDGVLKSKTTTQITYRREQAWDSPYAPIKFVPHKKIESINYENNIKTESELDGEPAKLIKQTRTLTDPETGAVTKHVLEQSGVEGELNSTIIHPDGREEIESLATEDENGDITVQKNFKGLDGTSTKYKYKTSTDCNEINMFYQIKDSSGKVLTTVDRKVRKINDNSTYSSLNGHEYVVEKTSTGFKVNDITNNTTREIFVEDFITDKYYLNDTINFLETLPADMILNLADSKISLEMLSEDRKFESMFFPGDGIVSGANKYIFAHEQGHSKDYHTDKTIKEVGYHNLNITTDIATNPTFRKAYEEEKGEFLTAFPDVARTYMNYFIGDISDKTVAINRSPSETIAEINALLSTGLVPEAMNARNYYLQKYFPRTIVAASTLLMPNSNLYQGK